MLCLNLQRFLETRSVNSLFLPDVDLPNTLALPSRAQSALLATTVEQLQAGLVAYEQAYEQAYEHASEPKNRVFVMGSGSNLVLPESLPGLTVLMQIKGIQEQSSDGNERLFEVGAGESWQGFVRFCLGQGLGGGIENLTLIPGTVGAAPIQNIGAYGVEVAQFIDAVQVFDLEGSSLAPIWLDCSECEFGYRDSIFRAQPGRWVVTQVRFRLQPHREGQAFVGYAGVADTLEQLGCTRITPATISEAIARLRRSKLPDPRKHPNAGSFFKNPVVSTADLAELHASLPAQSAAILKDIPGWPHSQGRKLAAAALIDRSGFKRKQTGGVGVWYRQPLVLVNTGGADAKAIRAFAQEIRQSVKARFGISLEQEPVEAATY